MLIPQRKFREIIFQILYSQGFAKSTPEEICVFLMRQLKISKKITRSALEYFAKIPPHLPEIDAIIVRISKSYDFERISSVEKNILRLGIFELLFEEKVPPKVAISEALRICRKYGTPEGSKFVNALLDNLLKETDANTVK